MEVALIGKIETLYGKRTETGPATGAADLAVVASTPLETAEGSDELRFALFASAVVAGGVGLWYWMSSRRRKATKKGKRRKARGFLL